MEIRAYWRVLMRKWWIVLPTFVVTLTTTIVLTFTQMPVYETTATFVVTPSNYFQDTKSFIGGLETLSRRTEIATTYAEIATSNMIKRKAADELGLSSVQRRSLSVDSQLLAGTNVLEITVKGNDPSLVSDFANTVGTKTMVYVRELYEVYDVRPLDPAPQPRSPIKPNKPLNLALGATLGLALGVGLAFFADYLQAPVDSLTQFSVVDEEAGVYNKRYLVQRLGEEMSRARRNKYPLSMALLKMHYPGEIWASFQARSEVLRKVSAFLGQYLRKEDILARYDDSIFAFLLPDVPEEEAKVIIEKMLTRIAWTPFEIEESAAKLNLSGTSGIVGYHHNGTAPDELLMRADEALQQAELADYGGVALWSGNGGLGQDEL